MYKLLKYSILLIIILLLYNLYFKKKKKKFWYTQPIVFNKNSIFGINNKTKKKLEIKRKIKDNLKLFFLNRKDFKMIVNFLNNNYEDNYFYTEKIFEWHIKSLNNDFFIPCFKNENQEIVGLITGKIINLNIINKEYKVLYVDFLCVNKKYRSKEYAIDLINECYKFMDLKKIKFAIFKKDYKKLYVDNYIKFKVYFKKVDELQYINSNLIYPINTNFKNIFDYVWDKSKYFKINNVLKIEDFEFLFLKSNNFLFGYFELDNKNMIKNLVIYYKIYMKSLDKFVINILFLIDNDNFLSKLKNIFIKNKIELIYLDNTMFNKEIIDYYSFNFNYNCYLYFFNFNISNLLKNNDLCLKL